MPDIATIGSALSSIKTAAEIAKLLRGSDASLASAEIKLRLAELTESLAEARFEIADIQSLLVKKDEAIRDLEGKLKTHESLSWENPVYYLRKEGGKEGPFCPQCYDNDNKMIRLQTNDPGSWHCRTCGNGFDSQSYVSSLNSQIDNDNDPLV